MTPSTLLTLLTHVAVARWWWRARPGPIPSPPPGSATQQRQRRPVPFVAPFDRIVTAAVSIGGALIWPPWGCCAGLAMPLAQRARRRRDERRRAEELAEGVTSLVVLSELCLHGGVSLRRALGDVSPWLPPELRDLLTGMLRRAELGANLADEFDRAAASHPPLAALAALVASTERYGAPVGPALATLAAEARHEQRQRLERRARRVPVRLLGPLIAGVLPAFVLLSVVPMLAAALVNLRLGWR